MWVCRVLLSQKSTKKIFVVTKKTFTHWQTKAVGQNNNAHLVYETATCVWSDILGRIS